MWADPAAAFFDTGLQAVSFEDRALHWICGGSGGACRRAMREPTRCGHGKHRETTRRRTRGIGAGGVKAVHGLIAHTAKRRGVERIQRVPVRANVVRRENGERA